MGQGRTTKHDRVLAVIRENAASLLRLARLHSLCADDAQDAYQRALEIYLRRIDDIDDATAGSWLRTVVKHEAIAQRAQRYRYVGDEPVDLDQWESLAEDEEEKALSFERMTRAAEALQWCKHDEVSAMVLKAEGHSYKEICSLTGWSYTKVNRCLAEGRARFLERFAAIESGAECERLAPLLSAIVDGEADEDKLEAARPHLRNCSACRATLRELQDSQPTIHSVLPVGLLVGSGDQLGLVARAWELLFGTAQNASLKLQAMVEASSATKVAAVAASAAAVAGGGAVAVERSVGPSVERPRVRAAVPISEQEHADKVVEQASAPAATPPAGPAEAIQPEVPRRSRKRSATEFGFEGAGAPPTPPARPVARAAAATGPDPAPTPSAGKEKTESFGFER